MKNYIHGIFILFSLSIVLFSCGNGKQNDGGEVYQCPMKCEGKKTYSRAGNCPVCKMDLKLLDNEIKSESDNQEIPNTSVFNLTSQWITQNNDTIELKDLQGDVLVMVMIYTSCQAACPRLVADMRNIHDKVNNNAVKYVLISIDPETDTPERLKEFAIENQMNNDQWIFLNGTEDDVREFSNVVAVKYKQISPFDFSHSNIISVFDRKGVLRYQQEGLGVDNKDLVAKIHELIK